MNYRMVLRRMWGSDDLSQFEAAIGHPVADDPEAQGLWRQHVERIAANPPRVVPPLRPTTAPRAVALTRQTQKPKRRKHPWDKLSRRCRWCGETFQTTRAADARYCEIHGPAREIGELPDPTEEDVERVLDFAVRGSIIA